MSKDTCEENKPTSTCFLLLQDCGSAASDEEAAPRYMPAGISRSHEYCSVQATNISIVLQVAGSRDSSRQ